MAFLSEAYDFLPERPLFGAVIANTLISTIPGISGAGPSPEKTLLTPNLDSELIAMGCISSVPARPNTPTGCPTPATITRAMVDLCGITPLFINAGLMHPPTVPTLDLVGECGRDPRKEDAVPGAERLFGLGKTIGATLSRYTDLLVLGECVPGGTTTALCVLRALGYDARVSSSYVHNPVAIKDQVLRAVLGRIAEQGITDPPDILRAAGDPMMPVAAGIAMTYTKNLVLAGGTQMLAVAAVVRALQGTPPVIVTTRYVRDDRSANVEELAAAIGNRMLYVDPGFAELGHSGLARYCIGEVKEGMGAGGAMFLAYLMGHQPDAIRARIFSTVLGYV